MTTILGFFFVTTLLNDSHTCLELAPSTISSFKYYHRSNRERVSCRKWLRDNKQGENILYLFATAVALENQALHLKLRYDGDRRIPERIQNETVLRPFLPHMHVNFSSQLHHFLADLRIMDHDLNTYFIPRLKSAEVGEEDYTGYGEAFRSLIHHCFELRCKINYWIRKKTRWLIRHYNATRYDQPMNAFEYDDDDDDDDDDVNKYFDLLVMYENDTEKYHGKSEAQDGQRYFDDYSLLKNLIIQLNWFVNREYIRRIDLHLHPKREEENSVNKREEENNVNKRDYGGTKRRRINGRRGMLSMLRQNGLNNYNFRSKSRFRNRGIYI